MKMKKFLAILLSIAMVFSLAACTGSGASQVSSQQEKLEVESTVGKSSTPTDAEAKISGNLSLLCWHDEVTFKPILDAFAVKYPDVTIDFQNVPAENSQYSQRLTLLANSGELPDVFWIQPPLSLFAENGYLVEMDNLEAVQNLPETYRNAYMHNGKIYAYVNNAWIGGIFYNKTLFEKYDIKPFETWQDFLDACEIFTKNGIKPIAMGGTEVPDLLYWLHLTEVLSEDADFNKKINNGEVTFEDGYLEALKRIKADVVDTGYLDQSVVGYSDEQRFDEFATGLAATTISGPWAVSTFEKKNPDLDLGIMPYVGTKGQKYTIGAVNVGIAISSKAKNMPAAEAFVNFMGSEEGIKLYQGITGNFMGVDGVEYEVNPVMQDMRVYAENGNFAFPPVDWTYSATIAPMIEKGLQEIVLGTKTPEQLIKELDDKQRELMADAEKE